MITWFTQPRRRPGRLGALVLTTALLVSLPSTGLAAADTASTVTVTATGTTRTLTSDWLGLNGGDTSGPSLANTGLRAALTAFGPGTFRYPGGSPANYWRWKSGWFQSGGPWPGQTHHRVNDTLATETPALLASGATPIFDLNVLTDNGALGSSTGNPAMLRGQLAFLRAAAADGWPVKLVELGNELYLNGSRPGPHGQDYTDRFATATAYADQMNSWIAAIHQAYPDAQVAAVGTDASGMSDVSPRRAGWDSELLAAVSGENAVTIHEDLSVRQAQATPAQALATPQQHMRALTAGPLAQFQAAGVPVWITEFGMAGNKPGVLYQGSWLNGLYVADQLLLYLRSAEITHVDLNGMVGNASTGAFFANDRGFGSGGPATTPMALTAAGSTLALLQTALRTAVSAQPLAFAGGSRLTGSSAPALAGDEITTAAGTSSLLLENMSGQPVTLSVSGLLAGAFTVEQLTAASAATLVTGPSSVTTSAGAGTGTVTLPPYSLAELTG